MSLHRGAVAWLTGLPGSGKSTIVQQLARDLERHGIGTLILDGDDVRRGLCSDLTFSRSDRRENARRVAEVCRLAGSAGVVCLVALITPFAADRDLARSRISVAGLPFLEVFVDASREVCEQRDPKGLYARSRKGELEQLTGISDPYEAPERPDVHVRTELAGAEECAVQVLSRLLPLVRSG